MIPLILYFIGLIIIIITTLKATSKNSKERKFLLFTSFLYPIIIVFIAIYNITKFFKICLHED